MIEVRRATQRGITEHVWLTSRHTFSFGNYRDAQQLGFSDLLVINDDRVIGGRGFEQHSHRNMEIFSYVISGALEHRDNLGNSTVIRPGDVQIMSAGSGIAHSELNHSRTEEVHFLQIWIVPDQRGVTPRYQQAQFPAHSKRGRLRLIISPDADVGSLTVHQDVRVYAGTFDRPESQEFSIPDGRYAYVHVARGSVSVNGLPLGEGDGVRVREESKLTLSDGCGAEVLLFDLRPHDNPELPH